MKKITLTFAAILFMAISTYATVWTVNNNSANNSAANYTSLQTAIDSASTGDTLYVSGSPLNYGTVYVNKQLVFIGAGYREIGAERYASKVTTFTLIDAKDALNNVISTSSGSVFTGFLGNISSTTLGISNISIIRNKGTFSYCGATNSPAVNWIFINNIITNINYYSYHTYCNNFQILNNIITGICYLQYSTAKNNLFLNSTAYITGSYITENNNIHHGANTHTLNNSTIKNNLSYASGSTTVNTSFDYATTNFDTNNVVNQDPKFVNVAVSISPSFDYAYDYHLQSSSPAIGAGTNGTDIGIYGGDYPFPSGGPVPLQTSALPGIPQITDLQISNFVIPIDSALHIHIKARVRD